MTLDRPPQKPPATAKDLEQHLYHIRRHIAAVERHTSFWPSVACIVTSLLILWEAPFFAWCALGGLLVSGLFGFGAPMKQ